MRVVETRFEIPKDQSAGSLLGHFGRAVREQMAAAETPVRFAVVETTHDRYVCELGVLSGPADANISPSKSIFDFKDRRSTDAERFNVVLAVPTGVGSELGGHAGDAGPAAQLMASVCDTLVTHPNVVNGSDINELPSNGLYVEGSTLSRLLMGTVGLMRTRANRVMLVADEHSDQVFTHSAINAASASRAATGVEVPVVITLDPSIRMHAGFTESGRAAGRIEYLEYLVDVLVQHRSEYDAVALTSPIIAPEGAHADYFHGDMVNPWGGVEAMLTHAVSLLLDVPAAHAPMEASRQAADLDLGIVDPRKAAEAVSVTYLHSVLKGLHRSPRLVTDAQLFDSPGVISAADVDCLVIPEGCVGLPTLAAAKQGIPVVAVREAQNLMKNDLGDIGFADGHLITVDNYWEAVGVVVALREGISPKSVRRPFAPTKVHRGTRSSVPVRDTTVGAEAGASQTETLV